MSETVWLYAIRLNAIEPGSDVDRAALILDLRAARPDLSLTFARALVDKAPQILLTNLRRGQADAILSKFRDRRMVDLVNTDGTPFGPGLTKNWPWAV